MIPEETELEIFDRLKAGETVRSIAHAVGVAVSSVAIFKLMDRPRWRYGTKKHREPTSLLIAWHRSEIQSGWDDKTRERRRVTKSLGATISVVGISDPEFSDEWDNLT